MTSLASGRCICAASSEAARLTFFVAAVAASAFARPVSPLTRYWSAWITAECSSRSGPGGVMSCARWTSSCSRRASPEICCWSWARLTPGASRASLSCLPICSEESATSETFDM